MQSILAGLRQSTSVKAFTIGFLILLMLIPLGMVRDAILDRNQISQSAKHEVREIWGAEQLIAGPVLVLPYTVEQRNARGEIFMANKERFVLPKNLDITASVESDILYRGIHAVPVYSTVIRLRGSFAPLATDSAGIDVASIDWNNSRVAVGVSDGRAILESPEISVAGQSSKFRPGGQLISGFPPQILAPIAGVETHRFSTEKTFDMTLKIKGSQTLSFLPLGDSTSASVDSAWPSPSFFGSYLPEFREIDEAGFNARWAISSIGRKLPASWTRGLRTLTSNEIEGFGVRLFTPIDIYRLTLRAVTYGVLFIALTFVAFFLFEVMVGLQLHPIQYLKIGFSNVVFFLLLISLAEHVGFGWAYLLSALASSSLVVAYSLAVLGQRGHGAIIGLVLCALYGFLYMTLRAETYALLAGAIGLWITLALLMYLTRRINWYQTIESLRKSDQTSQSSNL